MKKKYSIGFLVGEINFGGGERILNMLIQYFHKKGYSINIFTWNKEWLQFESVYKIHLLNYEAIGFLGKFSSLKELRIKLLESNVNCLIVFSIAYAEVALWSAKLAKIPIVLSERVDPNFSAKNKFRRFYKKILFRYADGVVFQTNEVKNYYSKFLKNNYTVIHNPIIDDNLPSIDFSIRKEIVTVGRLSSEKRIDLLISAFSKINNKEYNLLIYGDGPQKKYLQNLIIDLNLRNRVLLKGKVDRVVEHINGSDIFVLCSELEGMPNALIEAMSMRLACISTNFPSGGASELISDYENGLLIDVNDKDQLTDRINLLIANEHLKNRIKDNCIKIRLTHSKDEIMPKWENFLHQLIN